MKAYETDHRREGRGARRPPDQGTRRRLHDQLRIRPPRRRVRARHPALDRRVQQAEPGTQGQDPHRPQHRRGRRGGRRHLRRRRERRGTRRGQGQGWRDPCLRRGAPARRPGGRDDVRISRPLQAQGISRPLAPPRGHTERGQGGASRSLPSRRRLRRTRAGTARHPDGARPRDDRLGRHAVHHWRTWHRSVDGWPSEVAVEAAAQGLAGPERPLHRAGRRAIRTLPRGPRDRRCRRDVQVAAGGGREQRAAARRSSCPALRQKVRGMPAHGDVSADKLREQLFRAVFDFLTDVPGRRGRC